MKTSIKAAVDYIKNYNGRKIRIMEVCGTHTHEIFRLGLRELLNENVEIVSGPGCPVCVTPPGFIDEAVELALDHNVTICTFGDLVRVPGTEMSLSQAKAEGAKVKIVYSPQDAEKYAAEHPDEEVAFLSIGFETTTPSSAIAVKNAIADGAENFTLLTANKTMPGAYEAMADYADAFLYPGHVHAISGIADCEKMLEKGASGVIAGFTSDELISAIAIVLKKSEEGKPFLVNAYPRVVKAEGSPEARALVNSYMEKCDAEWRGIGIIADSGMMLKAEFEKFDAEKKFGIEKRSGKTNPGCRCGEILKGVCKPKDCPLFGKVCSPEHPVGACMVSNEGTCSAYYLYGNK
ncbi:MAG: hydrogenase formation protein HypD [Lachnospiraceae bacterium]|nr:hydrogenase formation protein HypD [Lachnospiraceae bacterium]